MTRGCVHSMFQSKAIEVFDFKKVNIPDQLDEVEREVNQTLEKLTNKHAKFVDVEDQVKAGDIVTLDLESTSEKYNRRNLPIVVGAGLFNKVFEEQLLNQHPNKTSIIKLNGDDIKVIVTKIKRKIMPELTDELVKQENIDSVFTVEDYRKYAYDGIVAEKVQGLVNITINKVIDRSEFTIVEEDINRLFAGDLSKIEVLLKEEGRVLEEMTEAEIAERIGTPSLEKFEEVYKNERYPKLLKQALIGLSFAQKNNVNFDEATYEKWLGNNEYFNSYSSSDAKQLKPFFNYLADAYSDYAYKKIAVYFNGVFH